MKNKKITFVLFALLMMGSTSMHAISVGTVLKLPFYGAKLWYNGTKRITKFVGRNWEDVLVLSLLTASAVIWKKNYDIRYGGPGQPSPLGNLMPWLRRSRGRLSRQLRGLTEDQAAEGTIRHRVGNDYEFVITANGQEARLQLTGYPTDQANRNLLLACLISSAEDRVAVRHTLSLWRQELSLQAYLDLVWPTILADYVHRPSLVRADVPVPARPVAHAAGEVPRRSVVQEEEVQACGVCIMPLAGPPLADESSRLDRTPIKGLPCGHIFHKGCLQRWLGVTSWQDDFGFDHRITDKRCSICRGRITRTELIS